MLVSVCLSPLFTWQGEVGAGANMKLVVNMLMGSMMAAFAEALVLADKVRSFEQGGEHACRAGGRGRQH